MKDVLRLRGCRCVGTPLAFTLTTATLSVRPTFPVAPSLAIGSLESFDGRTWATVGASGFLVVYVSEEPLELFDDSNSRQLILAACLYLKHLIF